MSEKEETLLECYVCFGKYNSDSKSPLLLLCGHTFCTECLTHLAMNGAVVCPNCRQHTSVGTEGIKELKRNVALISLLDTLHKFEFGTICDECEDTKAERWCDACTASFCSRCCTSVHKRALKHHKRVALKDKAIASCETHTKENLSFFCLKCEVPICNICRDKEYGEHGSHKVNLVDRVEEDQRKELVKKRSEIKENVSSLEELSKLVSDTSTTLKANEESAANLINSTFAALFAAMEERKSNLLKYNKSKCQSSNDKLKKQRFEIASLVADFSVLSEEYARASSRKGVGLLLQLKSLSSRANKLDKKYEQLDRAPVASADVSCELPKNKILDPLKRFGSIAVTSNNFDVISNNFDILITKCEKVTSTSLKLFWKAKTRAIDVVKYVVQRRISEEKQSADGGWKEVKRTKSTSETISSLVNNTSYDFRVCGLSELMKEPGPTGWSYVKTFKTAKDSKTRVSDRDHAESKISAQDPSSTGDVLIERINNLDLSSDVRQEIASIASNSAGRRVDLWGNNISDVGAAAIAEGLSKNSTLQTLYLEGNNISAVGAAAISEGLSKNSTLTILGLRSNNISDVGAAAIAEGLSKNSTLTILGLRSNNISDVGAAAIVEGLSKNSTMTILSLEGNNISDVGAAAIGEGLSNNSTLQDLNLDENNLSDVGAAAICEGLSKNSTLTKLYLRGNNISDVGAAAICEGLSKNSTLEGLYLGNKYINDVGAAAICEVLSTNSTLTILDLDNSNITDVGAAAICEGLSKNSTLTELYLRDNNISDVGAAAICEGLSKNSTLEGLYLGNNDINDVGAAAISEGLSNNSTLTILDLEDNNISDVVVAAIGERLSKNSTLEELYSSSDEDVSSSSDEEV